MVCGFAVPGAVILQTIVAALIAVLPVRVTTNSGETFVGELSEFGKGSIIVDADGESRTLTYEELASISPVDAEAGIGPNFNVTLLTGSRIAAQSVELTDDTLVINPRRQPPLKVRVQDVKSIRFQPPDSRTDPKWLGLLEQEGRGDLMAIRRQGERLDPYRGLIKKIVAGTVSFDLDETPVEAPIEKLEGVIFGGNRPVSEDAAVRVKDKYGSTWAAESIVPGKATDSLTLTLTGSLEHTIRLDHVVSVSWNSGLQLLSEVEPADQKYQPFFPSSLDPSLLQKWFGPTRDGEADLVVRGGSTIDYRIEPGFSTLAGSVQRSSKVNKAGTVVVTIALDDTVRWKETLSESERLGFELPLADARRIRVEVISGEDGDLGDTVRINRLRLVK